MKTISVGHRTFELEGGMIPIGQMIPNYRQPRMRNLLDPGLRRSIMETRGLVDPLLVEKIAKENTEEFIKGLKKRYETDAIILEFLESVDPEFLIVDGERRWVNSLRIISETPEAKAYLGNLPCDIVLDELSEKERYILWVSIHKLRREWKAMEKETAAQHLIKLTDPANASAILGITLRKLQKFIATYELAQRMREGPAGPRAISYARETMNLAKKYRDDEVVNAIVDKVNRGLIRDAVDIRKLRTVCEYPEVKKEFLKPSGTIKSTLARVPRKEVPSKEIALSPSMKFRETITQFKGIIVGYSWQEVQSWKGNKELTLEVDECIKLLRDIKQTIS